MPTSQYKTLVISTLALVASVACSAPVDRSSTPTAARSIATAVPTATPIPTLDGTIAMQRAMRALDADDNVTARKYAVQAIRENPQLGEAHILLGRVNANDADLDSAEAELKRGIDLLEKSGRTQTPGVGYKRELSVGYSYLGYVQTQRATFLLPTFNFARIQGYYQQAEVYMQKAVEVDPTNAQARAGLETVRLTMRVAKSAP